MPSVHETKENPFAESMKLKAEGNSLGDDDIVKMMLQMEADDFIKRMQVGEDKGRVIEVCANKLVRILFGRDRRYTGVRKWNEPKGITPFLKKWVGSKETKPRLIAQHAALSFFNELMDVIVRAGQPRMVMTDIKPDLDALFNRWTNLFMGVPPNEPVKENASN
jgi:hypothetical protein